MNTIYISEGVVTTVPITIYEDAMERKPRNLLSEGYGARAVLVDERGIVVPSSIASTDKGTITISNGEDNIVILWGAGATASWSFESAECQVDLTIGDQSIQRIKFNVEFVEDGRV